MTEFILSRDGRIFITADHGNAEKMIDKDMPFTAHTNNKVPFIFVGNNLEIALRQEGGALCDIAPTVLQSMELEQPLEMTGKSLIEQ
jgi:2,3-bisphosphoglycerate-independent phosphoglycerate mutase